MNKSSIFKLFIAVAVCCLVFACKKPIESTLIVHIQEANFAAAGNEPKSIDVKSNVEWTVSCPDNWVTVAPASGAGDGVFTITVSDNPGFDLRYATVTVKTATLSKEVVVTQLGLEPVLRIVSADDRKLSDNKAATVEVELTGNVDWTVSIPEDCKWITANPTSGHGDGKVVLSVAENTTTESRQARVGFNGVGVFNVVGIKIVQPGLEPSLSVTPGTLAAQSRSGANVELSVTSNVPWALTIPTDCDWISASAKEGTGDAKVTLTIAPNVTNLKGRAAVVNIKTTVGDKSADVNISQEEALHSRVTDSLALVAIYNAADGANWKDGRVWDLTKPMDDASAKWYGVKLANGRVSELNLANGTITKEWSLPEEIGDLLELVNLRFVNDKLAGVLPESIFNLVKLQNLYLTNNTVKFTMSAKFAVFTELVGLYIDQNANVDGSLPKELGNLKKLANLNIAKTSIGGAVPAELSGCAALKGFMVYGTKLTSLPDNLDQWPLLTTFQVYDIPTLTGELPKSIGNAKKVTAVWMYNCNFTGNVPESYGNLPTTCTQLRLQGNKLQGTVPDAVKNHTNWKNDKWKPATYIFPQQDGYGLN